MKIFNRDRNIVPSVSINNCYVKAKPGHWPINFDRIDLDGYAIIPRDEYEKLVEGRPHISPGDLKKAVKEEFEREMSSGVVQAWISGRVAEAREKTLFPPMTKNERDAHVVTVKAKLTEIIISMERAAEILNGAVGALSKEKIEL